MQLTFDPNECRELADFQQSIADHLGDIHSPTPAGLGQSQDVCQSKIEEIWDNIRNVKDVVETSVDALQQTAKDFENVDGNYERAYRDLNSPYLFSVPSQK
ncbi:MAG: hypothetical protein Q4P05_06985 [Actinomycetaceae bacterium]|nr:hypothetical protein [Actinomycetaceae bacterium]